MKKTYVIDTSALIDDPHLFSNFPNSEVIIPIAVLNELDNLKKNPGDSGKNARVAIRIIDSFSELGDISEGIEIEDEISIKVDATYYDASKPEYQGFGDPKYGDTQILICALVNQLSHLTNDVTLITNDINLRIKARSRGINSIALQSKNKETQELYAGLQTIVYPEAGLELQQIGYINPIAFGLNLNMHECVLLQDEEGNEVALGRKVHANKVKLVKKYYPWDISARNTEQACAMDLIMDRGIDLVTLTGKAGTGKTLMALACALELVLNRKEYDKLIIYRPIQPVGNDIGYTPGTIQEKLEPWFQAILDTFEFLFNNKSSNNKVDWKKNLELYQRKGQIEMDAITYVRGRSIPNSIIFIDEVQNLPHDQVKTLLTRAGNGTKIILSGDLDQIDTPHLDPLNNGLMYVAEKFKTQDIAGHISFTKGERSRLATVASKVL